MNGYELTRQWWDFAYNSGHPVKPEHHAVYLYAVELCNRLGWKQKFAIPTTMTMEAVGIRSYKTYINVFRDLCEWGVIQLHEKSTNQYSANVIALVIFTEAQSKALDKAILNHLPEQVQSTDQSSDSIIKQQTINQKPETINAPAASKKKKFKEPVEFIAPTLQDVKDYFKENGYTQDAAERAFRHYDTLNWHNKQGKPVDNWKNTMVNNWFTPENKQSKTTERPVFTLDTKLY